MPRQSVGNSVRFLKESKKIPANADGQLEILSEKISEN